MVKKEKKKLSKIKVKKKVWYKIIAPRLFGSKDIGESYLTKPESAIGRKMKINLRELTGSMKDQQIYIQFIITKVVGTNLQTEAIGYELTPAYIKRVVRKNTARIDDVFNFKTKNGKEVVLKSLIVTRGRVQRSVKSAIRVKVKELLLEEIGKSDFNAFLNLAVGNKVQFPIKKKLAKIYPVREVSVRSLALKLKKGDFKVSPVSEEVTEKKASEVNQESAISDKKVEN
jgi:small subunit ribosomal protein S3Ae